MNNDNDKVLTVCTMERPPEKEETVQPKKFHLTGLVAATFTPMRDDGSLALDRVKPIVDHLLGSGVRALYVCGSTGEGPLLTTEEREVTAKAYIDAAAGRIPVVVQVGHSSLVESCRLAAHAQSVGASAISATPPCYFKPASVEVLVRCLAEITRAAPKLPFYYYHLPLFTGVDLSMVGLLNCAAKQLPTLVGIKFSDVKLDEFQLCAELDNCRFNMLFGCDEMLLSGLAAGANGEIGSTYNFLAPLYNRIVDAFYRSNIEEARRHQAEAIKLVRIITRYRRHAGLKATMKLIGIDCGPNRLPIESLQSKEVEQMRRELESAGFFESARVKHG